MLANLQKREALACYHSLVHSEQVAEKLEGFEFKDSHLQYKVSDPGEYDTLVRA